MIGDRIFIDVVSDSDDDEEAKKTFSEISEKLGQMAIGSELSKPQYEVSKELEADISKCTSIIHEKRKEFKNDFPLEDLLKISDSYAAMISNYISALSQNLSKLPANNKAKHQLGRQVTQIKNDLQRIGEFMVFLIPFGLYSTNFLEQLIPLLEEVETILDKAIELKALSSREKDNVIVVLCQLLEMIYNSTTNEDRHAMESAHHWIDALSNQYTAQTGKLKIDLYSKQIRLDIKDGMLSYADMLLNRSLDLIDKFQLKSSDDSTNCKLLAQAYADAKNYPQAYYWMRLFDSRYKKFVDGVFSNANNPLLSIILNDKLGKPSLESEKNQAAASLNEYRAQHISLIEDYLKQKHPEEIFRILKKDHDVLKLNCAFSDPQEGLKRMKSKMATQSKMIISFDLTDSEKKHIYFYPLITISQAEISAVIKLRDDIKHQLLVEEKNRKERLEKEKFTSNAPPNNVQITQGEQKKPAEHGQKDRDDPAPKPKGKKAKKQSETTIQSIQPDPTPPPDQLSLMQQHLSDAAMLGFDETSIGKDTKIHQCRLRGYGNAPFYVGYIGEEKKSDVAPERKQKIINTLFNVPKIVPAVNETGFHRVKGVLVGKHKEYLNRLIPCEIQKGPAGIFYGYGNFIDYHTGADRKNLEEHLEKIPRKTISPSNSK